MATCAASRSLRISQGIRFRSLLVSSLENKRSNSSVPVRYIPKDFAQIENPQTVLFSERDVKTEGSLLKSNVLKGKRIARKLPKFDAKERPNSHFYSEDSKSSEIVELVEELPEFGDANSSDWFTLLSEAKSSESAELVEELPEFGDAECSTLDLRVENKSELVLDEVSHPHVDNTVQKDDSLSSSIRQDAVRLAIELLAARAFTEFEMRKKLRGKKFPLKIVDSVMADIKCRGLLNDGLYAETFSRSRWISATWGPKRIKQALVQKGVNREDAEKATKQVFEGDDFGDEQTMKHGMSRLSMDRLFLQASKQWTRGQSTSPENRKVRMVRWLQYRGFNWGVTSAIIKKLEAQCPP